MTKHKFVLASLALASILSFHAAAHAAPLASFTVSAGDHLRVDTPISARLEGAADPLRPMRMVEIVGEERVAVPYQNDPQDIARIWWILSGETQPGATRKFELEPGTPLAPAGVKCDLDASALEVSIGGAKILRYNHAFVVPPEGVKPEFIRNGYIHPLWSPKGAMVTEDFPADHYHHKGVWFPWTHTEFEGHEVDFWNLGDKKGTVQFCGFTGVYSGPVFGGFRARHDHIDMTKSDGNAGGKVALNEEWDVRVWNVGGPEKGYWLWELASTQRCASESPLKLLKYRYGGMGFRGAQEWKDDNYKAISSEGKTHKNGHMTKAKWCDNGGKIDDLWRGVLIMDNPANFRFPQSMRLWDKGGCFFNYAPVQEAEFSIEPGKDYVSRYRFMIHDGEITPEQAERHWQDWGDPPKVEAANAAIAP